MHNEIKESGLAAMYEISPITDNLELAFWLGKKAQYRRELLNEEFLRRNGTISLTAIFEIRETQKNYKGDSCLRGYDVTRGDTFGRVIHADQIELI